MLTPATRIGLAVLAGACFGALDAVLVMQGGVLLLVGNVAALWLALGCFAGRLGTARPTSAALGAMAESTAVVAFYAVKGRTEGAPLVLAATWLGPAVVSGPVMGALSARRSARPNVPLLALGIACCAEPLGWTALRAARGGAAGWHGTEVGVWAVELAVGLALVAASAMTRRSTAHTRAAA